MKKIAFVPVALIALALPAYALMRGNSAAEPVGVESGLPIGENLPAFDPTHVSGPDKGTNTCPVCKYGARPAIQVWVNGDSAENLGKIGKTLDDAVKAYKGKDMKAFVIWTNFGNVDEKKLEADIAKIAKEHKIENVGMTYLSADSKEAADAYKINKSADVKNTVFVYKDRTVKAKFVNVKAEGSGLAELKKAIGEIGR